MKSLMYFREENGTESIKLTGEFTPADLFYCVAACTYMLINEAQDKDSADHLSFDDFVRELKEEQAVIAKKKTTKFELTQ